MVKPVYNTSNMEKADIKKLFPLTVTITQTIIDTKESIGEQLLRLNLPEELHADIFWGLSIGSVGGVLIEVLKEVEHNGKNILVPFYLQHSDIKEPVNITFTLRKHK